MVNFMFPSGSLKEIENIIFKISNKMAGSPAEI